MYKLIQKYQKKLLAIFAVLLMIAFVATLGVRGPTNTRGNPIVGHIGQTPLHANEMQAAKDQWLTVKDIYVGPRPRLGQRSQRMPLPYAFLPPTLVADIDQHPELFLLLQREAEQHGLHVNIDNAKNVISTLEPDVDVNSNSPRVQVAVAGARGLALISAELRRLEDAVKISQPVWQHDVAEQYQSVRLNLVEFNADEFVKGVPAPTKDQLRQQFEKYRDVLPHEPGAPTTSDNPLGFGYKIPARVKLQYIEIPRDQVARAVTGSSDPKASKQDQERYYNWRLKAADYYDKHPDEFRNQPPATAPATPFGPQPATRPSASATQPAEASGSATQPAALAAATQPAIKPFKEVEARIIQKLIAPDVDQERDKIEREIADRLNQAWTRIRRADPSAVEPTTAPAAAAPVALVQPVEQLMSVAYLEQIRTDIQQKYQVDIKLADLQKDWLDSKELAKLPGLGGATTRDRDDFAKYATTFVGQPRLTTAAPVQVWESSQMLTDVPGNAYVFRLTAAEPPHAPPDISPVARQVEEDWKLAQAYDKADGDARKLLEASKSVGLPQAARAESRQMITATAGPFVEQYEWMRQFERVNGYDPKDAQANEELVKAVKQLLATASSADRHPEALVELPTARRAVVLELADAHLMLPDLADAQEHAVQQERSRQIQPILSDWFTYDNVVARLGYKAEEKS